MTCMLRALDYDTPRSGVGSTLYQVGSAENGVRVPYLWTSAVHAVDEAVLVMHSGRVFAGPSRGSVRCRGRPRTSAV